jgi:hypothetical protein
MVNRRITSLALSVGLRLSLAAGVGLSLAACGSAVHPGGSAFPGRAGRMPRQGQQRVQFARCAAQPARRTAAGA